jgi:hypothetical protein
MLWGDMLLHKSECTDAGNAQTIEEAKKRREAVAKDAIICDWHYDVAPPEHYKSLNIFKDSGFRTIACSWYTPANIANFAKAAEMYGAWGLLQTTWAGYSLDEKTLDREFKQFAAWIPAAEYAWNPDSPPPEKLPWRAEDVFAEAFGGSSEPTKPKSGFTVDLRDCDSFKFSDTMFDLSIAPIDQTLRGYSFAANNGAVRLAGAMTSERDPRSVTITLGKTLSQLVFLHATWCPAADGENVGEYQIVYQTGETEHIPLIYGRNIRSLEDTGAALGAKLAWRGKTRGGVDVALRMMIWSNPHPEKPIVKVVFKSDHPYASPMLIRLTGIDR